MTRSLRIYGAVMVSALALGLAACGDDDSPSGGGGPVDRTAYLTTAWQGIWQLDVLATSCTGEDTLINEVTVQVFCAGDPIQFGPFDIDVTCEGSVTNTTINVRCDTTFVSEGCNVSMQTEFDLVRDDDTFSGTATSNLNVTGCAFDTTACVEFNVTAVRVNDGSFECATAATSRPRAFSFLPRVRRD